MSNPANTDFVTPIGRLVSGDPFEKQTKDQQGNPMTVKTGPNAGQATQRYFVGLAFNKTDVSFGELYAKMDAAARAGFPHLFNGPPGQDGRPTCTRQDFAWKITDGDGFDSEGKPNRDKIGYAGCWVVRFTSSYAPKVYFEGRYAPQDQISEANRQAVRRGYYGRVVGTMQANGNAQKPGLYLNLNAFILSGLGEEIKGGLDVGAAMAGITAPANMPAGMTALPSALPSNGLPANLPGQQPTPGLPAGPVPSATPALPASPVPQPAAPLPAGPVPTPGATPAVAVQPHTAILAGPGAGPAAAVGGVAIPGGMPQPAAALPMPTMPAAPAVPAEPQPTAKMIASGYTLEQYLGGGWTREKLISDGYLA